MPSIKHIVICTVATLAVLAIARRVAPATTVKVLGA